MMKNTRAKFFIAAAVMLALALPLMASGADKQYKVGKYDQRYLSQANQVIDTLNERGLIYSDPEMENYIRQIVTRLNGNQDLDSFVNLDVYLFRHPLANAFSMGNGTIMVSLGLISRMENENMLAGVLAHELAHVKKHHALKSYRNYVWKAAFANVSMVLTGTPLDRNLLFQLSVNGYSRKLEKEADMEAIRIMKDAGYDPNGLVEALEELTIVYEGDMYREPPVFWMNHPKTQSRIDYLSQEIGYSPELGAGSGIKDSKSYIQRTLDIRNKTCEMNIELGRYATAKAIAQKTINNFPRNAEAHLVMGMILRDWAIQLSKGKVTASNIWNIREQSSHRPDQSGSGDFLGSSFEEALSYFKKATELDPGLAVAYREMGELYAAMGDKGKAISSFRRYLDLSPDARDRSRVEHRIDQLG